MSLTSDYGSAEYKAADRLFKAMESRTFSEDAFSQALIDMSGGCTGVLVRVLGLYLANAPGKFRVLDFSSLDNDTLDAVDWILRLDEVLREAQASGRL